MKKDKSIKVNQEIIKEVKEEQTNRFKKAFVKHFQAFFLCYACVLTQILIVTIAAPVTKNVEELTALLLMLVLVTLIYGVGYLAIIVTKLNEY